MNESTRLNHNHVFDTSKFKPVGSLDALELRESWIEFILGSADGGNARSKVLGHSVGTSFRLRAAQLIPSMLTVPGER
jgi:hypothetical protein